MPLFCLGLFTFWVKGSVQMTKLPLKQSDFSLAVCSQPSCSSIEDSLTHSDSLLLCSLLFNGKNSKR